MLRFPVRVSSAMIAIASFGLVGCSESSPSQCNEQEDSCPAGFTCSEGSCVERPSGVDAGAPDAGDPVEGLDASHPQDAGGHSDAGLDLCREVTCSGHGTCVVVEGAARCVCDSGYREDQLGCVPAFPAPTAAFTFSSASPVTVQQELTLDASGSTGAGLQFRWDFEADGIWDTDWTSSATARRRWHAPADYKVRLEVKDTEGRTAQSTDSLQVTWFGRPAWIGVSSAYHGNWATWTTFDTSGVILSQTEPLLEGSGFSEMGNPFAVRQASDGRVLAILQCMNPDARECREEEIIVASRTGKTSVFTTMDPGRDVRDILELPDGTWLLADALEGEIVHLDADGNDIDLWAMDVVGLVSLELTADGTGVLVALASKARIDRYNLAGEYQGRWDEVGKLQVPAFIRRLPSGGYMVSDHAGKLVAFDGAGRFVEATGAGVVQVPTALVELTPTTLLFGETCTTTLDQCGRVMALDRALGTAAPWTTATLPRALTNVQGMVVVHE